jgi:hypothetical protein
MLPGAAIVHLGIDDACNIRRQLDFAFLQSADFAAAEFARKPEHFPDDVLTSAPIQMVGIWAAHVIGREQHNGEPGGAASRLTSSPRRGAATLPRVPPKGMGFEGVRYRAQGLGCPSWET